MPWTKARSKNRSHGRTRTSSQSSIEIQVTENAAFITTATSTVSGTVATPAATTDTVHTPPLVCPSAGYLKLIKQVGAQGNCTHLGELFTIKQLCFYLTEYIKMRNLWDLQNQLLVHCQNDPLSLVFGVDKFTLFDALNLIKKNTTSVDMAKLRVPKSPQVTTVIWQQTKPATDKYPTTQSLPAAAAAASPSRLHIPMDSSMLLRTPEPTSQQKSGAEKLSELETTPSTSFTRHDKQQSKTSSNEVRERTTKRKKRKFEQSVTCSESESCEQQRSFQRKRRSTNRKRQPSFSIMYNSDLDTEHGSYPWYFRVQLCDSSDSEVLSIQSKETALVKDSSDDLWFLDESDHISMEMDDDVMSIEIQSNQVDPPFSIEYDVDSEADENTAGASAAKDIVVVCDETDIEFWADSESSDAEDDDDDDNTEDDDMQKDMWRCEACDTLSSPMSRYCDRCRALRPDWLPSPRCAGTWCSPGSWSPKVSTPNGAFPWVENLTTQPSTVPASKMLPVVSEATASFSEALLRENTERRTLEAELRRADTMSIEQLHASLKSTSSVEDRQKCVDKAVSHNDSFRTCSSLTSTESVDSGCTALTRDDSGIGMGSASQKSADTSRSELKAPLPSMSNDPPTDVCTVCLSRPKEASIIHGRTGHQVCCYPCAKRLKRHSMCCPVCRRPIERVIRNYVL